MDWSERDLDRIAARLQEMRSRQAWGEPEPDAALRPLDSEATPYESARSDLRSRERRLDALAELGERLARELLPPAAAGAEDEELVTVLRGLQEALFRHPLAFRGAFAALVAEGRRYARTEEGAALREGLAGSPLLPRLRLFGKMLSFSMLEEGDPQELPSAYLEGLFRLADHPDADRVLDRLFGGRPG